MVYGNYSPRTWVIWDWGGGGGKIERCRRHGKTLDKRRLSRRHGIINGIDLQRISLILMVFIQTLYLVYYYVSQVSIRLPLPSVEIVSLSLSLLSSPLPPSPVSSAEYSQSSYSSPNSVQKPHSPSSPVQSHSSTSPSSKHSDTLPINPHTHTTGNIPICSVK